MKYIGMQIVFRVSEESEKIEFSLVRSYLVRKNTNENRLSNAKIENKFD